MTTQTYRGPIMQVLTEEVVAEICSRFEGLYFPDTARNVILSWLEPIERMETDGDYHNLTEAIEGQNMHMLGPMKALLSAYFRIKRTGLQTAEYTGDYICPVCKRRTFRVAGQAIAPCGCGSRKQFMYYWDWYILSGNTKG